MKRRTCAPTRSVFLMSDAPWGGGRGRYKKIRRASNRASRIGPRRCVPLAGGEQQPPRWRPPTITGLSRGDWSVALSRSRRRVLTARPRAGRAPDDAAPWRAAVGPSSAACATSHRSIFGRMPRNDNRTRTGHLPCSNECRQARARVSAYAPPAQHGHAPLLRIYPASLGNAKQQGRVAATCSRTAPRRRLGSRPRSQRLGPEPGQASNRSSRSCSPARVSALRWHALAAPFRPLEVDLPPADIAVFSFAAPASERLWERSPRSRKAVITIV